MRTVWATPDFPPTTQDVAAAQAAGVGEIVQMPCPALPDLAPGLNTIPDPPSVIADQAIAAGLQLTSTGTPALDGTYAVDDRAQKNIVAVVTSIADGQGLPGGGSTVTYLDVTGVPHDFTATQFAAFAVAARNYVYAVDMTLAALAAGQAATWPSNQATIP